MASPWVTSASPFTHQCSARCWHLQAETGTRVHHDAFDLRRSPLSIRSYHPHGLWTLRCWLVILCPPSLRRLTRVFTSWVQRLSATNTASAVSTTTTSRKPTPATSRLLDMNKVSLQSWCSTASPMTALPRLSCSVTFHRASQDPRQTILHSKVQLSRQCPAQDGPGASPSPRSQSSRMGKQ